MKPLKLRIFFALCKDTGTFSVTILLRGNMVIIWKYLQRVYELKDEISIFLQDKNPPEAEKFRNGLFVMELSYLVDIFEKLSILNLKNFEGANTYMLDTSDKVNPFCRKLELWSRNLKQKT